MLVIPGSTALSEFRRQRLVSAVKSLCGGVANVRANYVYLASVVREISTERHAMLERLLFDVEPPAAGKSDGELFLVMPRPGTISAWASKATDIAHSCGLREIERIERGVAHYVASSHGLDDRDRAVISTLIHDRMTQLVVQDMNAAARLFHAAQPAPLRIIDLGVDARSSLDQANRDMGLALSDDEIDYLAQRYLTMKRSPTDAELMMFAQANSEHCRHKTFNAQWIIDGRRQDYTLFSMIRNTYRHASTGILSAYKDNAAVIRGAKARRLWPDAETGAYREVKEDAHIVIKVETHNHPTAISPFPGAATGAGGEIRDGAAVGAGGKPKAGLCGFSVSHLRIPGFEQPWERDFGRPSRIASALEIMLEGPIGAAAFNNEFGRPNICGYFRTLVHQIADTHGKQMRGYHKPIMLSGGIGNVRGGHVEKRAFAAATPIVVLGGPAMLIGLGGGAASSMASGQSQAALDFASVQRSNAEMQRRCQEVIDRCCAQGPDNPILSIHDVGAGGLSNAIPELLAGAGQGGRIELRAIPSGEPGMSPLEIWCNEAQERFVLAIERSRLDAFKRLCERERCPYAVLGESTNDQQLVVHDRHFRNEPIALSLQFLLGKPPKMLRRARHVLANKPPALDTAAIALDEAIERVLRLPVVASKGFLITIGDRTVGGLVARDQMVGPWQVPVADVGVTCADFQGYQGEALAVGERASIALIDAAASGRMAVGEALTNIAAACISGLCDVRLSANWMAAAGYPKDDAALFDTVRAVGLELCPALGIAIPVGKDSLSMRTVWEQEGQRREVVAPLSAIISAFAPVADVRRTLTPQLRTDHGETALILIDLGRGRNRIGGSALAQVYGQTGDIAPDVDDPELLKHFFAAVQTLNREGLLLAYHDRSDGGLFATLCEMAFAGRVGVNVQIDRLGDDVVAALFTEELGAVAQVSSAHTERVLNILHGTGVGLHAYAIGGLNDDDRVVLHSGGEALFTRSRAELQGIWAETSYRMQALRDNPECAAQEFGTIGDSADPGLAPRVGFSPDDGLTAANINRSSRPRVAILREQGVNGQVEMAAAFTRAGFEAIDVHMSELIAGRVSLDSFKGLAAGGGFSYGDVLGAGGGWAKAILFNPKVRDRFEVFFKREDTFGLGVCNGCQMLSYLRDLIPGARHWPRFVQNRSEQFEGRLCMVEVLPSPSILLAHMQASMLPIAIAHGEGRAAFHAAKPQVVLDCGLIALRYVDNRGRATECYPQNPSGSPLGIAGLTNADGRFTIMMPHPERVFRSVQCSWHPDAWGEDSPWMRLFYNARAWLG
jgi:phosphoribosylformylglycinamidine synthase